MTSVTKYLVAFVLLALSTTANGGPNKPIGGTAGEGACNDDIERLCKGVEPGKGLVWQCLKSHQADVSKACAKSIQAMQAQLKKLSTACEPDVEKFCWSVPAGRGAIAQCLKKHQADLSADCKTAVAHTKKMKAKATAQPMQSDK